MVAWGLGRITALEVTCAPIGAMINWPIRVMRKESTMIQIGKMNTLTIVELEDRGAWLAADEYGELLLPKRQLPEGVKEGIACRSSSIWMPIANR